jgi:cytochrome P450
LPLHFNGCLAEYYKRTAGADTVCTFIAWFIFYFQRTLQTVSTLQVFFLAMRMYPEAQQKAQAQIDEVVGNKRLPEFSDIQNLPYIQAIVLELFRWQPITPLGWHKVFTYSGSTAHFEVISCGA